MAMRTEAARRLFDAIADLGEDTGARWTAAMEAVAGGAAGIGDDAIAQAFLARYETPRAGTEAAGGALADRVANDAAAGLVSAAQYEAANHIVGQVFDRLWR